MAFINEDNQNNESRSSPDREIQKLKGSWINKGTVTVVFAVLALYFAKDIGKSHSEKKIDPVHDEWTLPKEEEEDWKSYLIEPKVIIEKVKGKIQEDVNLVEKKIEKSPVEKKIEKPPVYEAFFMQQSTKPIQEDKRAIAVKQNDSFNSSEYAKNMMDSMSNINKPPVEKTYNEKLEVETLKATFAIQVHDLDRKILQGKTIPAILDFSMHTDLSGKIRAFSSENLYSQNGERLLAEKGSLLTGSYEGGMKFGINRIFVLWERMVTTDGVVLELGSPSIGNLGRSGLGINVDSHFWERFGSSLMLSVINASVSIAGGMVTDGDTRTINDIQGNLNKSTEMALEQSLKIKPTGYLNHGASIVVYVARDIEFPESIFEGK